MTIKKVVEKDKKGAIAKAYELARKAHQGQKRLSGEPYFNHVVGTAQNLLDWNLDETSVVAGLLHDVVEDSDAYSIEDVQKNFGEEVAFLVDGVTKLGRIKYRGLERQIESLRKMILALSQDVRVVLIKLADRQYNMHTLEALPPHKQKRIALETSEIYAPLAYRLGMQRLSGELEDLAFPYIYPQEHKWLKDNIKEEYEERETYLHKIKPKVEKALAEADIKNLTIDFRAKRHASLYKKLLRYDMDVKKIYDLIAFRIIVRDLADCYSALGVIHKLFPPVPGRIKDYIALPKPNGYQSIHTTVFGPDEKTVEFQIRTKEMHEEAENGIAAHWAYQQAKGGKKKSIVFTQTREMHWVKQLRSWQQQFKTPEEFLESLKIDFFRDRIFCLTPKGEVIDLPVCATPIDFAYQIHSDIGNQCVGARVNDQFVPLNYELKSNDVVEVITQKNKKPSASWLNFVKTNTAKQHIRTALKSSHQLLKRELKEVDIKITTEGRIGLLKDILNIISRSHVNISKVNSGSASRGNYQVLKIRCETADKTKIEKLILKLKALKEVKEISYLLV